MAEINNFSDRVDALLNEWETKGEQPTPSTGITDEEAMQLGFLKEEPQQPQTQPMEEPTSNNPMYNADGERQFQKLGAWESQVDMAKAVGTEISHMFVPKKYEKQYESKTQYAETMKYITRYGLGTLGFIYGGGIGVGGKLAALGIAKGIPALAKTGGFIQKALSGGDLINKTQAGLKAARAGKSAKNAIIGARAANAAASGFIAEKLADFTLYRPEENEGHLFDAFGDVDNKFIEFLQTQEGDSNFEARLKNMVEGTLVGIPVGVAGEFTLAPLVRKFFGSMHKTVNAKTPEEAMDALTDVLDTQTQISAKTQTMDLIEQVKALKTQADESGEELDQLIIDNIPTPQQSNARAMGREIVKGEDIYSYNDGTWAIRVTNSWEDAYKVSPEQYKRQLRELDETGDMDISHMNQAVKQTWIDRSWMGATDDLVTTTKKKVDGVEVEVKKGNVKLANKIVNNYKDKWGIDNKVTVEFIDNLHHKGQKLDGLTDSSKNQGRIVKSNKNAIDKKKLQIQKLEDKITMAEGGNKSVSDPLDNLKEELRIAKNELKELEETAKGANKLHNIVIKIDPNAKDPYATLRSELEHARDEALGTTPKNAKVEGSGTHFSRYVGDNEAEIASGYVHKKATGKAKATAKENEINQIKASNEETMIQGYSFKESPIDTFSGEGTRIEITNNEGLSLGYLDYTVNNNTLHIEQIMNSSYKTEQYEKGVAEKLVNNLISQYPEKNIQWDATTPQGMAFKEKYLTNHPELRDKTTGISTQTELDQHLENDYNSNKGGSNEGSYRDNRQQPLESRDREGETVGISKTGTNNETTTNNNSLRGLLSSNTPTNAGGKNTSDDIQVQLERLAEAQTTDDVVGDLTKGKLDVTSIDNIQTVIAKTIEVDPEISGKTFMDVAMDSESFFNKQLNEGTLEDAINFTKALTLQDSNIIDQAVREQIACTKVIGLLKDKLDTAMPDQYASILTAIKNLETYNKEVASAFGRALNYQKINKEALSTFGLMGLSDAAKEGVYSMADIVFRLSRETLGFTRNTPQNIKKAFYQMLEQTEPTSYQMFMQDKALISFINEELDKAIRAKEAYDPRSFAKALMGKLAEEDVNRCAWYVKLCDDTNQAAEVVTKFSKKATSYMINNVLGALSLTKNVASGIVQGVAFPTTKMLGGLLTGNYDISKEGMRTLQYGMTNFWESARLAGRAFMVGEGLMTNTKEVMDGVLEKGFHEWQFDFSNGENAKITLQNLHSFFPRCMMASDELLTQLNYRAIMRAKAAAIADNELMLGKITQADWAGRVDEEFKRIAVNKEDGRPLDFKAFAEAKDMLFQIPLDRKLFNPMTGQKEMVDTPTLMSKAGSLGQMTIEKLPPLRIFFPFIKTPVNIADSVIKSNPLYMAFSPDFRAKITSKDPMVKAKAVGTLAGSCLLYTTGIMAGMSGIITGTAPVDQKEKTALLKTGWKPYSIRLGDKYYSYQGLAPYDSIFAACADYAALAGRIQDKHHEMAWDDIFTRLLATTINTTVDQAGFRTNTAKILDLFNPSLDIGRKETVLASIASGLLPASANVRDLQTVLNGFERPQIEAQTLSQKLLKNYLPMFLEADYQRDVFGRRVDIHNYLITSASEEDFFTPEYQEMARLAEYGWTPSELKNVVAGTKMPLTDFKSIKNGRSAKDAFGEALYTVKIDGKSIRQAVAQLATDEYYLSLPVGNNTGDGKDWSKVPYDTQIKQMTSLFKEYADEAKKIVLDDSDTFVNSKGETMTEAKDRLNYEMELEADSLTTLNNLY